MQSVLVAATSLKILALFRCKSPHVLLRTSLPVDDMTRSNESPSDGQANETCSPYTMQDRQCLFQFLMYVIDTHPRTRTFITAVGRVWTFFTVLECFYLLPMVLDSQGDDRWITIKFVSHTLLWWEGNLCNTMSMLGERWKTVGDGGSHQCIKTTPKNGTWIIS